VEFPGHRDRLKTFPLDQPGDSLFFERDDFPCSEALFSINGIVSAAFIGTRGYVPNVSKLSFGQNISSGPFSTLESYGVMAIYRTCVSSQLPWNDGGTGYVGFRFNNGAGIQYGWARVTMSEELGYAFIVRGPLTPTPVNLSGPVRGRRVTRKRPMRVLSAGSRSAPRDSWPGVRVGPEPHG
jgi:hypothetical protein